MNPALRNGLAVAAIHVAIVASLGAKFVIDRATRPRVWARAAPVDPNLPIRGRYVSLRLEAAVGPGLELSIPSPVVRPNGMTFTPRAQSIQVALSARDRQLVAVPSSDSSDVYARADRRDGHVVAVLEAPVAYFIPDRVEDPSRRAAGEELWVEVTIPSRGAPRPIRLGVLRGGVLTPLEVK